MNGVSMMYHFIVSIPLSIPLSLRHHSQYLMSPAKSDLGFFAVLFILGLFWPACYSIHPILVGQTITIWERTQDTQRPPFAKVIQSSKSSKDPPKSRGIRWYTPHTSSQSRSHSLHKPQFGCSSVSTEDGLDQKNELPKHEFTVMILIYIYIHR